MNHTYHYCYKITNKLSGKYYIGVHSTDVLCDEYMGSSKSLKVDIAKLGKKNFEFEILDFFESRIVAENFEESCITKEIILSEDCYNKGPGGKFGKNSLYNILSKNEYRKFCSDAGKKSAKFRTDETKKMIGRKAAETKKKQGIKPWNTKDNITKKDYTESLKKLSDASKQNQKNGKISCIGDNMRGKKLSKEHKTKLREAKRNQNRLMCEWCGKDNLTPPLYKRWHGKNCNKYVQ
jgi:hypothetical protein